MADKLYITPRQATAARMAVKRGAASGRFVSEAVNAAARAEPAAARPESPAARVGERSGRSSKLATS